MIYFHSVVIFILCFFPQMNLSSLDYSDCYRWENDTEVCMCNETHCDNITKVDWCPEDEVLLIYLTAEKGPRLKPSKTYFRGPSSDGQFTITIDPCKTYQTIYGFGGALTDSASLVISCLPESAKLFLMNNYFNCDNGLGYNIIRINVGACDFSPYYYTYCDSSTSTCSSDPNLTCFRLSSLDTDYKIPLLKLAQEISCRCIHVKIAAWNAPKWMTYGVNVSTADLKPFLPLEYQNSVPPSVMKTFLKDDCLEAWANYYVKVIEAFQFCNLNCSLTISVGNEPFIAFVSLGFTSESYKTFLFDHLCPKIRNLNCTHPIRILALDDQTPFLPIIQKLLLEEKLRLGPKEKSCIDCVGTHWYLDFQTTSAQRKATRQLHHKFYESNKDICLWRTESTIARTDGTYNQSDWNKAKKFMIDIMIVFKANVQAYLDWNLALDLLGGPNWQNNYCDAAIKVDCEKKEFYKKILFYVFGHFSKFLIPGKAIRVDAVLTPKQGFLTLNLMEETIYYVAFKVYAPNCNRPNLVVILSNTGESELKGDICITGDDYECATVTLPPHSIISTVSTLSCDCST